MSSAQTGQALDRLKATARDLVSFVSSVDTGRLRRAPASGEWSAATVVAHMADAELVYAVRLRMIVAEDRPLMHGFDENAWAARYGGLDPDPRDALARWRVIRDSNVTLLEALVDDEWSRTGLHQERGVMSVAAVVQLLADHDRAHLDQIRAALT